jgi:hypothetical protein
MSLALRNQRLLALVIFLVIVATLVLISFAVGQHMFAPLHAHITTIHSVAKGNGPTNIMNPHP